MEEQERTGELAVQTAGDVEAPRTLAAIGAEIREHAARFEYHKKATVWEAVEIGRRLTEARDKASHGEWADFLTRETGYSRKIANNFIRVFDAYGDRQTALFENNSDALVNTYSHLSYSQALALLALPEGERDQFAAEHDIESMTVRELRNAIQQEREAREAAEQERDEAQQELTDVALERDEVNEKYQWAEQDRQNRIQKIDEINGDLEQARRELEAVRQSSEGAQLRISELSGQLDDATARRDDMAEKLEQAKADAAQAEQSRAEMERQMTTLKGVHEGTLAELEELKSKPVDVAVEPVRDEEAIEAARVEEREKLQAQYDQDMAALQEKLAAAQSSQQAAPQADEDMAKFKVIFEQVQGQINALHGIVMKIEGRGDTDTAKGLRKALMAVSDAVAGIAKGGAAA